MRSITETENHSLFVRFEWVICGVKEGPAVEVRFRSCGLWTVRLVAVGCMKCNHLHCYAMVDGKCQDLSIPTTSLHCVHYLRLARRQPVA